MPQPNSLLARAVVLTSLAFLAGPGAARADVTRIAITSRAPVGTSGYEKIVGIAHFAVDPRAPANAVIADLDRRP